MASSRLLHANQPAQLSGQGRFFCCRWGGTSVFAGLLVTNYGLKTGFVAYFLASIIALGPTAMLPVQVKLMSCLA